MFSLFVEATVRGIKQQLKRRSCSAQLQLEEEGEGRKEGEENK